LVSTDRRGAKNASKRKKGYLVSTVRRTPHEQGLGLVSEEI
jgi:hypothetical protein